LQVAFSPSLPSTNIRVSSLFTNDTILTEHLMESCDFYTQAAVDAFAKSAMKPALSVYAINTFLRAPIASVLDLVPVVDDIQRHVYCGGRARFDTYVKATREQYELLNETLCRTTRPVELSFCFGLWFAMGGGLEFVDMDGVGAWVRPPLVSTIRYCVAGCASDPHAHRSARDARAGARAHQLGHGHLHGGDEHATRARCRRVGQRGAHVDGRRQPDGQSGQRDGRAGEVLERHALRLGKRL